MKSVLIPDMPFIAIKLPVVMNGNNRDTLLLAFLQVGPNITYDHDGQFYKGYLGRKDGVYQFSVKHYPNVKQEGWGVTLPDLQHTWTELCVNVIFHPGHNAMSFLRETTDPVANILSAANLRKDCPSSLL